jgi:transposase
VKQLVKFLDSPHMKTYYLGIDVSKAKLDCLLLLDETGQKRKSKKVLNHAAGFAELLHWVLKQGMSAQQIQVTLEATSVYHEALAHALHHAGMKVCLANPAQARAMAQSLGIRTKTDSIDAFLLARFGQIRQPQAWIPPAPEASHLNALLARYEALNQDLQRERNRQEKAQSANQLSQEIELSFKHNIASLEKHLAHLQQKIDQHIDHHPGLKQDFDLLTSIRAIGPKVGQTMLSVIHSHSFRCAEQLAAYVGLVPVQKQSGSSVLARAKLSKAGNPALRAKLYMAAVVAIRYNPHVKALYERLLKKGKAKMAAIGACMRKLVHLCFGVIKNQTPYDPHFLQNA